MNWIDVMGILEVFSLVKRRVKSWFTDKQNHCERCDGTGVIQVTESYACRCDRCGGSGEA